MSFRKNHPFEKRLQESNRILEKYPARIPIICEKHYGSDVPDIDKKKYLVPVDLTMGQLVFVIRKRIKLQPAVGLFLFVNNSIPPTSMLMGDVYQKYQNDDGFLYVVYSGENTFG